MKTFKCLSGIVAALLGTFTLTSKVQADNPPWPPVVSVLTLDPCAAEEGSDPATFVVVRVGPANTALTVSYLLGGDAANGKDFETLPGTVTIPEGAYFAPVHVTPHDDFLIEGAESVVIALQQPPVFPPPYIVAWPSVAAAIIADNDFEATNQPPSVAIVHPPDGAIFEAYEDILLVARGFDQDGRVRTVEFFADGNSLGTVTNRPHPSPADLIDVAEDPIYKLDLGAFPILDLTPTPGPIPIPVPGDLFRLRWSDAPPGPHVLTAIATDNDGAATKSTPVAIEVLPPPRHPVVNLRATDPVASEPDPTTDALDTATFTIHRRGPTNDTLRVFYRIAGTADNGVDYREIPHSLLIPAGERRAQIVIAPLDDQQVEGPEKVILSLVEPPGQDEVPPPLDGYEVGRAHTARVVIRDNDTPPNRAPVVRLVKPEDGESFLAPADIRLAALARDFDGYVTTVEFFEGTNSLGTVTNSPDRLMPNLPAFTLVWSNVPPGRYILTAVATDNDGQSTESHPVEIKVVPRVRPPVVNIVATDLEGAETGLLSPPNTAAFEITRTGSTADPLVVFYRIGGSAENGADYKTIPNRVQIPSGASAADIVIEPTDDHLIEGLESVVLKLVPPPLLTPTVPAPVWWYRVGSNDLARVGIRDNDFPPTNHPPRVKIVHPEDGDGFEAPVDLKPAALTHDPDGWVRTVEFFDGDVSLGVVSNSVAASLSNAVSPEQLFRLLWESVPPGPHLLTAKATDHRGASSLSDPVHIKVLPPPCPPVVTIYAADPYASEGDLIDLLPPRTGDDPTGIGPRPAPRSKTATFTVGRSGCVDDDLTVYYRLDGTAINGRDYQELSGMVVIPRGAHRAHIIIDPIDDDAPEPTETVVATVVPPVCIAIDPPPPDCYRVGDPHRALAYIFDNDVNHSPKAEMVHPSDGDIFRAGSDIEIDVAARDPDGWVTRVEFFANHTKIGEQEILFLVPPPPGQLQRFTMTWSNVLAGDHVLHAKATDNRGAMSLTDPVSIKVVSVPPLPVVIIEAIDPVASEPNPLLPAFDSAHFRFARHGDLRHPITVHYRISGTASNGVDYYALSGVITIPSNSPTALIEVVPKHDALVEGTESVILALIQPSCVLGNAFTPDCYLVGNPGRDIAYIRDNDQPNWPPTVAIVSPPNGAVFCAPLDLRLVAAAGDPDGCVTTVEFFDGTNSLGIMHNPIAILDTTPVRLPGLNTDVLTANTSSRPFVLVWSNVPPGKHVLTALATDNAGDRTRSRPVEIAVREPNDLPVVHIMAPDAVAREGTTNTATFRLRRTGPTNSALTVYYQICGTAANGVDYLTLPDALTIPAGRLGGRLVVTPINDLLPERIESVLLRLILPPAGAPPYEIGRPARAGAVILDNDHPLLTPESVSGSLHLRLPLAAGLPFRLESSSNLQDWEEEACDINAEDGVSMVEDEMTAHPQRFFRVVPEYGELDDE